MTLKHSRREWLMGASNALGAALLGGQAGGAFASELRPERGLASVAGSSAFTAIDQALYRGLARG
jgi:hypothetical protein